MRALRRAYLGAAIGGVTLVLAAAAHGATGGTHTPPAAGFGTNGQVMALPSDHFPFSHEHTAVAPDGDIYVGAESTATGEYPAPMLIRRYLPDGRLDRSFGARGTVRIGNLDGLSFQLEDLVVDSGGLPYLVGTSFGPVTKILSPYPSGTLRAGYATVVRLTASGAVDPTYANGGVFRSDFSLPVPGSPSFYETPTVYGSRAVIDSAGRLLLLVSVQEIEPRGSPRSNFYENARLLARLTPSGSPDTTFGTGGSVALPDKVVTGLGVDAAGDPQLSAMPVEYLRQGSAIHLLRITEAGGPVGSSSPTTYVGDGNGVALAVEPDGSSWVVGSPPRKEPGRGGLLTHVLKIAPGDPASEAGTRRSVIRLPGHSFINAAFADGRGGVYLVGTLVTRVGSSWHDPRRRGLVVHLDVDGDLDPGFGKGGRLVVSSRGQVLGKGVTVVDGGRRLLFDGLVLRPHEEVASQLLAEFEL
jgi:uncharacterized delta-60 repeat protein